MSIDDMIKTTKKCTKALMRLSYINFISEQNRKELSCDIKTKNNHYLND